MSGSSKGRVLGPTAARESSQHVVRRQGVCAWCGELCYGPKDSPSTCPRCGSDEIDWIPAEPAAATPHQHFRDTHIPGSIAYTMLSGGRRRVR